MNPTSQPAAPTTPVTAPTWSDLVTRATSANTAPDAAPRAAAMDRNVTVPSGARAGWPAWTAAMTATTVYPATSTGTGCRRSDSQPPTGRISTARITKPAILFDASVGVSPYAVF